MQKALLRYPSVAIAAVRGRRSLGDPIFVDGLFVVARLKWPGLECFRALRSRGKGLGCFPYRINVAVVPELAEMGDPARRQFKATLKRAIDPDGICLLEGIAKLGLTGGGGGSACPAQAVSAVEEMFTF